MRMNRTFLASTAIAAGAWISVCAYLYFAWPSLAALLEVLGSLPPSVRWLSRLPRAAFIAVALFAMLVLAVKDRWLRGPLALVVDAAIAAPALAAIALLLEPFLVPVE
jgi:hypothetical protein